MRTYFGLTFCRLAAVTLRHISSCFIVALVVGGMLFPTEAFAKPKYAGIVVDAKSGKVLYSNNADARRYPASLTKMMTLYLMFEDLKRGKITGNTRVVMSRNAANQPPSKLGLKPGQSMSIQQAIYVLVTKSANDVATAVGEKLSGSEKAFARRMTKKARQLGMSRTVFKNASGLPNRGQYTTARDMSKLGLALREHFPRRFRYFNTRSYKFGRRRYPNHNRLLGKIKGVDGIKTGYTRASGFNLVSSVSVGNRRVVAVVMGGKTGISRNRQMTRLIKKYLPRATTSRAKILIARAMPPGKSTGKNTGSKKPVATPVLAYAAATMPTKRPTEPVVATISGIDRIQTAHELGAITSDFASTASIRMKLIALAATSMPLPSPSPQNTDPIQTGSISSAKVQTSDTPVTNRRTGWQIQIGATPTKEQAQRLLDRARSRANVVLASASNYLEPVAKGNTTLIRARFTGFASKTSARRACKYLKKKKFDCLAINR